jgi:hypothetical protein
MLANVQGWGLVLAEQQGFVIMCVAVVATAAEIVGAVGVLFQGRGASRSRWRARTYHININTL